MDRVVTAIDYGDARITIDDELDIIFYLIFELAEGDIRKQVRSNERAEFMWCAGALHHLAVAIQQLHRGGVCHNDIKPANILLFDQQLQKLADLGSATAVKIPWVHDICHDVGDPTYAAPEIIYADSDSWKSDLCKVEARRASDLYQLGSIAWFMVTGRMMTPTIIGRLAPEHRISDTGTGWIGSFTDILPFWREAQSRSIAEDFDPALAALPVPPDSKIPALFKEAVLQLVECDPTLRGHPLNKVGEQDQFGVGRYIALFNHVRASLSVRP
jgi:serine/threonine protein kinase